VGLNFGISLLKDGKSVVVFLLSGIVSLVLADEVDEFSFSISDWSGSKEGA